MGRPIADVMSWQGVDWLFRETRIDEEQPEAMLDALKIPPGATVADVGAGAGYHSIRLARRVGPGGTVLATDVQPEMIQMLKQNAQAAGVNNIKPLLCSLEELNAARRQGRPDSDGRRLSRMHRPRDDPPRASQGAACPADGWSWSSFAARTRRSPSSPSTR